MPLLLRQRERAGVRDGSEESPRSHIRCARQRGSAHSPVKRYFYGPAQRKLALTGKCHRVFRNDARTDRDLDTSTLWVRKDKSSGECIAVLVQRQLRRSLPLFLSPCRTRLNGSLPHAGDVLVQSAAVE